MNNRFLIALIVLISGGCINAQEYTIEENSVKEVISVLASDEMKGRKVFSPEIDRAADFLASKFEDIGLSYFDGLKSYRQQFEMNSLTVKDLKISFEGKEVDVEQAFAQLDSEEVTISDDNSEMFYIGPDANFRVEISKAMRSSKNVMVVINDQHKKIFEAYKGYFSRPSYKFSLGDDKSLIAVLTDLEEAPVTFNASARADLKKQGLSNVIGMIEGKRQDEYVIFSAHYDHIGIIKPQKKDSIANGANDDASGTTAVVELARYFSSLPKPERSLLFVTFTAEEGGGYGSKHFSKQLNPDQIIAMFNIEMIGKPAVEGPNTAWITGFDKSNFGELMQKSAEGSIYKFYADPYPDQNLFYRSDNATLARLGVPAHSISTTPIDVDKDYHQVSDEVETLDLAHLTNTIKAIAKGAEAIVSGDLTPTRVDTEDID